MSTVTGGPRRRGGAGASRDDPPVLAAQHRVGTRGQRRAGGDGDGRAVRRRRRPDRRARDRQRSTGPGPTPPSRPWRRRRTGGARSPRTEHRARRQRRDRHRRGLGVECVLHRQRSDRARRRAEPDTASRRALRAMEIARQNRLPMVDLVESGGADLPRQAEIFVPGGDDFRNLTQLSAARIPTIAWCSATRTAGGAYLPGMSDYMVMVEEQRAGLPRRPAAREDGDGRGVDRGGARRRRDALAALGVSDYLAATRRDAMRLGREIVAQPQLAQARRAPSRARRAAELRSRGAARDRLARPAHAVRHARGASRGSSTAPASTSSSRSTARTLVTGWARPPRLPGRHPRQQRRPVLRGRRRRPRSSSSSPISADMPLLFLQNITGYMVGKEYEQRGIIKARREADQRRRRTVDRAAPDADDRARSYGAGNYGMCGRAYDPRFLFTWPNHQIAVMGPRAARRRARRSCSAPRPSAAARRSTRTALAAERSAGRGADRDASRRRSSPPRGCGTTASSTRATRAPCSASRSRPCHSARSPRAPRAAACSGCI